MNEIAAKALFDRDVAGLSERLLTARNWKLHSKEFPVLDVSFRHDGRVDLRLRVIATNWNDDPPSVELLDTAGEGLTNVPKHPIFHHANHPITGRPFICMAGTREYHIHHSHVGDRWENYKQRDAYKIGGIITQIWNGWLKSTP